ncbi:MAG: hypothetical protein QXS21_07165 [Thermoproteota archaeon]|uniref:hypothetical protein n=1 Tax=Saccharolobus sp. TaxID=2100761 RepID=UPI00316D9F67
METHEEQHIPKRLRLKEKVKELTDLATYIVYASPELYERGLIPFDLYNQSIEKIYWKIPLLFNEKEDGIDLTVITFNNSNKKRTKVMLWYRLHEDDGEEEIAITIPHAEVIWHDYKEFVKAIKGKKTSDDKFNANIFTINDEKDLFNLNFILQNNDVLYKKEIANSDLETIEAEIREAGLEEKLEENDVHLLVVKDKGNTTLYVLKRK